ncbi:MAG: hypothetical protein M3R29_02710, partial [Verrucomicrobiota bacterium]|nr:hypothetical protein [Verrucomicrobiota bacterium]
DCFVPEPKQLSILSFAAHATRGLIRDQTTRRKTMFALIVVALILLFAGSTILQSRINPHEHPGWFIVFWAVCGWLTLTAILLAVFDLLFVRMAARKAERISREKFLQTGAPDSPRSRE